MVISTIMKKMLIGRSMVTEKGRIKLFGKMDWTLYPSRALAMNLQSIGKKLGERYLYQLGYEAGRDAGLEIIKYTGHKLGGGWAAQNAVIALTEFIGFGQLEFIKSEIKKDGHHHFVLHVKNNPVIYHAVELYGKKAMACKWFMGVYAAHGEVELGLKNAKIKETKCVRLGSPYCEWESRW